MRADKRSPVIASLRRYKGTQFVITLRSGEKKRYKLSTKANKWEQLLDVLDGVEWMTCEAQDEQERTLGVVESDADFDDDADEDVDDVALMVERLVKINQQAVAHAMGETRRMFADAMAAQSKVLESMTVALQTQQDAFASAMSAQKTAFQLAAAAKGGEQPDDEVMKMMMMAMQLMNAKSANPAPQG